MHGECELMAKLQGLSIKNFVSLFSDSVIHSLSVTILVLLEINESFRMDSPRSASEKPVVWHTFCLTYLSKLQQEQGHPSRGLHCL